MGFRWSSDRRVPTYELFVERMRLDPAREFVAVAADGRPVGWLEAYNEDASSGYAWIGVFMDPSVQGSGLGIEAIAVFIHYLFVSLPYRKLYANAIEESYRFFASGDGRFFYVEGRLREHEFYNGSFRDRLTLAVYRDEWREIMRVWGPRLGCTLEVD